MAKSKPETQQQQYRHGLLLSSWALGSHLLTAEYINPVVQFRYHCWIYLLHFNDIFATKASHMLIVNTVRNQARALTKFKFEALHILSLLPYTILGHTLNLIRIYRYHIPLTTFLSTKKYQVENLDLFLIVEEKPPNFTLKNMWLFLLDGKLHWLYSRFYQNNKPIHNTDIIDIDIDIITMFCLYQLKKEFCTEYDSIFLSLLSQMTKQCCKVCT